MKIKKFKINFSKAKHGWLSLEIKSGNNPMIYISASGVYNPFYDYVDVLYNIKHNRNLIKKIDYSSGKRVIKFQSHRKIEFYIDQEGYDALITFTLRGKFGEVETETLIDELKPWMLKKKKATFLKKQLVKEMKNSLKNFYNKNKPEINNDFYSFDFDKNKLNRI